MEVSSTCSIPQKISMVKTSVKLMFAIPKLDGYLPLKLQHLASPDNFHIVLIYIDTPLLNVLLGDDV